MNDQQKSDNERFGIYVRKEIHSLSCPSTRFGCCPWVFENQWFPEECQVYSLTKEGFKDKLQIQKEQLSRKIAEIDKRLDNSSET